MSKVVAVKFVQDRSGSMQDAWSDTVGGYKAYVADLQKRGAEDGIDYRFSLTVFDDRTDTVLVDKPIGEVTGKELDGYGPRGQTALYDGVASALLAKSGELAAEKYICIIVTDGQENASRTWNKPTLGGLIEAKQANGNWTFAYLGTQASSWGDAGNIGIAAGAVAGYSPLRVNETYTVMAARSHNVATSAVNGTAGMMSNAAFGDLDLMREAGMTVKTDDTNTNTCGASA